MGVHGAQARPRVACRMLVRRVVGSGAGREPRTHRLRVEMMTDAPGRCEGMHTHAHTTKGGRKGGINYLFVGSHVVGPSG